jgi:hypothetical protein
MTYAIDQDLNLARLIFDDITDFTDEEILEMELHLMDAVAIKRAGGEHLVCWEAAGSYQ